jgi:hypothetical protein
MIFFFDVRVNAILGGTSMRVIDTAFVYYLTWHREKTQKSSGTEFIPVVELELYRFPPAPSLLCTVYYRYGIYGIFGNFLPTPHKGNSESNPP